LAPLQGFHRWIVASARPRRGIAPKTWPDLAPSEVTVPYRVFPVWGSAIAMRLPKPLCFRAPKNTVVAPAGFRTLSTPCSPPDLPGLFHPGPASGVHPSRLCSAVSAVQISRPASTLMRFLTLCRLPLTRERVGWLGPRLSRALLTHRSQPATSGYCTICRCCCLHGLGPSEVCSGLVRRAERPVPLSRFADLSLLIVLAHGQVMGHRRPRVLAERSRRVGLSRGPPNLLGVSYLSTASGSLACAADPETLGVW
jgi:hypothetical protein